MKIFNANGFIVSLIALFVVAPALADPVIFEEAEEVVDEIPGEEEQEVVAQSQVRKAVSNIGGRSTTKLVPTNGNTRQVGSRTQIFNNGSAQGAARTVSSRAATNSARTAQNSGVVNKSNTTTQRSVQRNVSSRGQQQAVRGAINRSAAAQTRPSRVSTRSVQQRGAAVAQQVGGANAARATLSGNPIAATTVSSSSRSSSSARSGSVLSISGLGVGETQLEKDAAALNEVEQLRTQMEIDNQKADIAAQVADQCQVQYYGCMDDICASVDDELARCACSPNKDNYKELADNLVKSNEALQDVVRRIQYLGLTKDEVQALFTETQGEAEMSAKIDGGGDTTLLMQAILAIGTEDNLPDPRQPSAGGTTMTQGFSGLDINLDLTSNGGVDWASLMGSATTSNFNDIANMDGANLYRSAKNKCVSVLNECKKKKVDSELLQSKYDVEIGKACVAYESELTDQTNRIKNMVKNAELILQKARLQVMQSKNAYDLKGCISALDSCMIDNMVCGKNYSKCLDGTGKFIDLNNNVVPGADLAYMKYYLWGTADRQNINFEAISGLSDMNTASGAFSCNEGSACTSTNDTVKIVQNLLDKIGYIDTSGNVQGFCAGVLKQCQRAAVPSSSYNASADSENQYNMKNPVITNYLYSTLPKILAEQDAFITDYKQSCQADLKTCYSKQLASLTSGSYYAGSNNNVGYSTLKAAMSACENIGLTCAYAVYSGADNFFANNAQCQVVSGEDAASAAASAAAATGSGAVCSETSASSGNYICNDAEICAINAGSGAECPRYTGGTNSAPTINFVGTTAAATAQECIENISRDAFKALICPSGTFEYNSSGSVCSTTSGGQG
jgi:hypothetical protein